MIRWVQESLWNCQLLDIQAQGLVLPVTKWSKSTVSNPMHVNMPQSLPVVHKYDRFYGKWALECRQVDRQPFIQFLISCMKILTKKTYPNF